MADPGGWRNRPSRSTMTRMMKESVKTGHPTGLPDKLLRLFAPNEPLPFLPGNVAPRKPPAVRLQGIGHLVPEFAAPGDAEYEPPRPAAVGDLPQPRLFANKEYELQARLDEETRLEKAERLRKWRIEKNKKEVDDKAATFDPTNDPMIEGDPYKTLFVSRLSYEVTERKLRHEFEEFGPIRRIRLVHDRNSDKPRGYAFIEYDHKADMKEAYKASDGRKVEGKRILVDVERGRTVEAWRPMRLGGGLGGDSRAPKVKRKKQLADAAAKGITLPPPGGFPARGGFPPRDFDRGPPGGGFRGPPPGDRFGGPPRGGFGGPPPDRYGGGPPGGGGGHRDRGPPPRDYDRGGDRGRDYGRPDGGRDSGRGSGDYKRSRDDSPARDYKRRRDYDDDRRRDY